MKEGSMEILLIEDSGWEALRPLTWLRPAGELFVGSLSNRERWVATTGLGVRIHCRAEVARLHAHGLMALPEGAALRLWARDRWAPDEAWIRAAVDRKAAAAWWSGDRIIAVLTDAAPPAEHLPGSDAFWQSLAGGAEGLQVPKGKLIVELSDLISEGAERLKRDLDAMLAGSASPDGVGDGIAYALGRIRIGAGCRIDHGAVLDAREGPIVLGAGTVVFPHTWIRGPFGCRNDCLLLGGRIGGGSFFGPVCRVRGEVEASVFHGYTNKAHDGFIGHSYIGEWVNLGALTTTSDLKNNYGFVHLDVDGRRIETGQSKVGAFLGDHAKTRIGALLNSGTVVGIAANLFGEAAIFPKWVPDFAWGTGPHAAEYALGPCMEMVRAVLARRGHVCSTELTEAMARAFEASRPARNRFLSKES
jgi:UDP-N-acetylglucosamine diphosphorylase/glucosamine-1-phosphate N-acetyltransferase